jgi:DNA (cytosine-5)-methyltransferase 1
VPAYYNENDLFAAAWLRELMAAGLIARGVVDERSIEDVHPHDLRGFRQCHFFAGIGVWSYALRLAGWPDDRPVWTGSCPCQPFSAAGKRAGASDERHLWPAFFHLIEVSGPPVVLGEQVASPDGLAWLGLVQADLEGQGYAVGAADLCAAGVGAPHIRQRLYWVADALRSGRPEWRPLAGDRPAPGGGDADRLADAHPPGRGLVGGGGLLDGERAPFGDDLDGRRAVRGLAHSDSQDRGGRGIRGPGEGAGAGVGAALERPAGFREDHAALPPPSLWGYPDWLLCRDGRWRPVESGTFPLADGSPARVGRLRGYGNAIVPQAAAAFIRAYLEC